MDNMRLNKEFRARATTSPLPGTTLGIVRFPIEGGAFLYDTPGVINKQQLAPHLSPRELHKVLPGKKIKPVTYILRFKTKHPKSKTNQKIKKLKLKSNLK